MTTRCTSAVLMVVVVSMVALEPTAFDPAGVQIRRTHNRLDIGALLVYAWSHTSPVCGLASRSPT